MAGRHAAGRRSQRPYVIAGVAAIVLLVMVLAARFLFDARGRPLLSQRSQDCVGLTVVSSPDKADLMQQLAASYVGTSSMWRQSRS